MFKSQFDQAHGLLSWDLRQPTRVIPLVDLTDTTDSLELLWALESGFRLQGCEVAVVDGLNGLQPQDAELGHQAVLSRWLAGVPQGSVVLLHVPLEAMAVLLSDSLARPLVAFGADKRSVVQAYNAVKVLVQAGGLQPVLMLPKEWEEAAADAAVHTLTQTCGQRLGVVPSAWRLEYDGKRTGAGNAGQDACLLRVLDSALTLDDFRTRQDDDPRPEHRQSPADQNIGVPDVHRQRYA